MQGVTLAALGRSVETEVGNMAQGKGVFQVRSQLPHVSQTTEVTSVVQPIIINYKVCMPWKFNRRI